MRSLRGSIFFGALLWTFGLIAASTIAVTLSPRVFESFRVVHAHGHLAGLFSVVAMAAGLLAVRSGLRPFRAIRARLADVRSGASPRLEGRYTSEVQPLVDDLNALLAQHEAAVARANAKAADLAHGLKTPLAVLSNEAGRLAARGEGELASILAQQVALMQRQINYQLAQARAVQGPARTARSVVTDSVDGLTRALARLHASRGLTLDVRVGPDAVVRCAREDLDELLGNLLDNACKWAASRVVVSASTADDVVTIDVDDDGPGLPASRREAVLQRGVRADEAVPGSGLGLAIVRDIAELHGGSIVLDGSPAGGLRARLRLPSAHV